MDHLGEQSAKVVKLKINYEQRLILLLIKSGRLCLYRNNSELVHNVSLGVDKSAKHAFACLNAKKVLSLMNSGRAQSLAPPLVIIDLKTLALYRVPLNDSSTPTSDHVEPTTTNHANGSSNNNTSHCGKTTDRLIVYLDELDHILAIEKHFKDFMLFTYEPRLRSYDRTVHHIRFGNFKEERIFSRFVAMHDPLVNKLKFKVLHCSASGEFCVAMSLIKLQVAVGNELDDDMVKPPTPPLANSAAHQSPHLSVNNTIIIKSHLVTPLSKSSGSGSGPMAEIIVTRIYALCACFNFKQLPPPPPPVASSAPTELGDESNDELILSHFSTHAQREITTSIKSFRQVGLFVFCHNCMFSRFSTQTEITE